MRINGGKNMKKVRFIYNPYSGENVILNEIDTVVSMHQEKRITDNAL